MRRLGVWLLWFALLSGLGFLIDGVGDAAEAVLAGDGRRVVYAAGQSVSAALVMWFGSRLLGLQPDQPRPGRDKIGTRNRRDGPPTTN